MDKANQLSSGWEKQKHSGNFPGHQTNQVIYHNELDILLNFAANSTNILIYDFFQQKWESVTPTGTPLLITGQQKIPICISNKFYLFALGGRSSSRTMNLDQLIIQTRFSYKMTWQTYDYKNRIPFLISHSTICYQDLIYVFGGKDSYGNLSNKLYILNIEKQSCLDISVNGSQPDKRYDHSSLLYNGKMYIFGGISEKQTRLQDLWMWNLQTASGWEKISPDIRTFGGILPVSRSLSFMQGYENNLYIFKGQSERGICEDLLCFKNFKWKDLTPKYPLPFQGDPHLFFIRNKKLIIGQNLDLYLLDISSLSKKDTIDIKSPSTIDYQEIKAEYAKVFEEKPFPDVIFKVQDEEVPAHRVILIGRSKYFRNMFSSGMVESQSQTIQVPNVKANVFKAILKYIYCNEVDITEDIAADLLKLSDEYSLNKLKTKCEHFLIDNLKLSSIIEVGNAADTHEAVELREEVIKFMMTNIGRIFEMDGIPKINKALMEDVFTHLENNSYYSNLP